jgi:anti-sigma B factor antagonist
VESEFQVEVQSGAGGTVLALSGELDLVSSAALEAELERVNASAPELVIVDLRKLEFIDSTGLSTLVKADQRAQDAGSRFAVVNGPPQVQRLLSLTGIGERMTVVQTPEELLGGD